MKAAAYEDAYLPGHGDRRFAVRRYDLDLDVAVAGNHLRGLARLDVELLEDLDQLAFDLRGLEVRRVTVDGKAPKKWSQSRTKVLVRPAKPLRRKDRVTVEIAYSGNPRLVPGPHGPAGWEELDDGVTVAAQPQGAPSWFPCNDHPGDKAAYRIRVAANTAYRVLANGTLIGTTRKAGRTVWTYEQPEPMATYLATLQIGRYAALPIPTKAPVEVEVVYPQGRKAATAAAFARQGEMVEVFAKLFGPYPFPVYRPVVTDDTLEIPLEAQTLSIFGRNHLTPGWENERLIAHELAHQWFGNSLTATRWRDIWLHEGFACYSEWLWSEHSGRSSAAKHARTHWDRLDRLPKDLILTAPGVDLMFDDRIYKRGALTLHALRTELGDKRFGELLRGWTKARRHGSIDTAAFIKHAEAVADRSLGGFFDKWLTRPSLPKLP